MFVSRWDQCAPAYQELLVDFVDSILEGVCWLCFFIPLCDTGLIYGMAVVGMQLIEQLT